MDESTEKALQDWRMQNEGFPLQSTIEVLEKRYGLKQIIKKYKISGPVLSSVDCLSKRSSCYDKTHVAICLIRPKDLFWKNLEFAGVYNCGGDFFVSYTSGAKKDFKKGLPVPEESIKLPAQNLVKVTDGPSAIQNRINQDQAAMAYVLAFASYVDLDSMNESHTQFILRFDQQFARLNGNLNR